MPPLFRRGRIAPPAVCFWLLVLLPFSSAHSNSSDQWQRLLHFHDGQAQIPDSRFLSMGVGEDLISAHGAVEGFRDFPQLECDYPARALYLRQQGLLSGDPVACPEFDEFRRKVPVDTVSLIFASEHLTRPSSMMGHIMLSMSGVNDDSVPVDHVATFFTSLDFSTPLTFISQTLFTGKEGFFVVQPLGKAITTYRFGEQRNVWRYPLALTDGQKALLQAHLWELRQADIPYLFQGHNCATMTLDILRAVLPEAGERRDWISPVDVVRYADRAELIGERKLMPSDQWQVRMLADFMTTEQERRVEAFIQSPAAGVLADPLEQRLALTLARFRFTEGFITETAYQDVVQASTDWPEVSVSLDDYRDPLKSAPDSHLSVGWRHQLDDRWLTFGWLPAAHDFNDDNRNYFGETLLRLTAMKFRYSRAYSLPQLDEWMLYETAALNPRHSLTGGVSGYFNFGFRRFLMPGQEHDRLTFLLSGGVGAAWNLHRDIGVYALLGAGIRLFSDDARVSLLPEVGAWIYKIGNMKSRIRIGYDLPAQGEVITRLLWDQSLAVGDTGRLVFIAGRELAGDQAETSLSLDYRHYF